MVETCRWEEPMPECYDPVDDLISRLGDLYRQDPVRFEVVSRELIRKTIENFPPERRQRAFGLQFRLDATLNRYKDPVARMNKMVEILWEHLRLFQDVLNDPGKVLARNEGEKAPGKVIPFPGSRKLH
jgi:hypothetical protein